MTDHVEGPRHLETNRAGGVLTVTFRRPEAFNALDEEMAAGLVAALTGAQEDPEVRVVLVTGTGPAFSAGADLEGDNPVEAFDDRTMQGANAITRSIVELDKPVVVADRGGVRRPGQGDAHGPARRGPQRPRGPRGRPGQPPGRRRRVRGDRGQGRPPPRLRTAPGL